MKPFSAAAGLAALAGVLAPLAAKAQDYPPPPPSPPSQDVSQFEQLPPLEQLLAPIALYPDPIIALILPASTLPDQLQSAAANPSDPNFDPSIQGLEHYPEVLRWMAANPTWTQQLGGVFANSPSEVMNAIQALRQQARNAGTLTPSAYEQIQVDPNGQIEILPVDPTQIYLPSYNPEVVYWGYPGGYPGDYFGWSRPYPAGDWLSFDFDWRSHALWHGNWYGYHREYGWNRRPDFERWHQEGGYRGDRDGFHGRVEAWRAPANHPPRPEFRSFQSAPRGGGTGHPTQEPGRGWTGQQPHQEYRSGQPPGAYTPQTSAQPNGTARESGRAWTGGQPHEPYRGAAPQGGYAPQTSAQPHVTAPGYAGRGYGAPGAGQSHEGYASGAARPVGRPAGAAPYTGHPQHSAPAPQHAAPPQGHQAAAPQSGPSGGGGDRDRSQEHQR